MRKMIASALTLCAALGLPIVVTQAASAKNFSCVTYAPDSTGPDSCAGGFSTGSIWFSGGGVGLERQEIWTWGNGSNPPDSTATWTINGLVAHEGYKVEVYIPNAHSDAPSAHYSMFDGAGVFQGNGFVNQESVTNNWAVVGFACSNGTIRVRVDDSGTPVADQIGADALKVDETGNTCS